MGRKFIGNCFRDAPLTGTEGSRKGQNGELSCHACTRKASADPGGGGASGAGNVPLNVALLV